MSELSFWFGFSIGMVAGIAICVASLFVYAKWGQV